MPLPWDPSFRTQYPKSLGKFETKDLGPFIWYPSVRYPLRHLMGPRILHLVPSVPGTQGPRVPLSAFVPLEKVAKAGTDIFISKLIFLGGCRDKSSRCRYLGRYCRNYRYARWMASNCKKTCNKC